MNNSHGYQASDNKYYRVLLLLLVGLASFSSAMNELNQVRSLTLQAGELVAGWSNAITPTASASVPATAPACINNFATQGTSRADEFRWSGVIQPGSAIEVKGVNGEIVAEPTSAPEVQVVALKTSHRSDVNSVQIKVVPNARGVTICALYPNDYGEYPSDCGVDGARKDSSAAGNVRNNDVQVNFTVRIPARVAFVGTTVNGSISATSLTGNVITRTVNGAIKISTTGYAEANTINGEINARLGDGSWPNSLTFKTINGEINLDLPANLSTAVDAQTLNGSINSDFPLNVINLKGKKTVKGTIGSGGRDLFLRTLNGSINLRIAG